MVETAQDIKVGSLAQFSQGSEWRLALAHSRKTHLLIWITRGQGRVLLDGMRRGLGAHNALFVPAGSLFALDIGRQTMGQVVQVPFASDLRLPEIPRHLRIRDVQVQGTLTGLIEAAVREQQGEQPLRNDALEAHTALMSVWLRRQIMQEEHIPEKRNAAARLSQRFCTLLPERHASGVTMADYAADLGVTATHLTRAVKAATGKTAAELHTECVLHAARVLLEDSTEPARAIATHLGFGSAAYFTRFVQHHTGKTPSKLRGTRK